MSSTLSRKALAVVVLVVLLTLGVPPASAAPRQLPATAGVIQTLYVLANGKTVSTVPLTAGKSYVFRLTGMYIWGGCDEYYCPSGGPDYVRWADAFYRSDDHFDHNEIANQTVLWMDGKPFTPQAFQGEHIYTQSYTGAGLPVSFKIYDCEPCYADNYGSIRVEIMDPDEPAPIVLGAKPFPQRSVPLTLANWGTNPLGDPNVQHAPGDTVCKWGCFVSSWAMLLDYYGRPYGKHTNPGVLNEWLRAHDGYNGNFLWPERVMEYANSELFKGQNLSLLLKNGVPRDDQKLHDLLAAGIPVILELHIDGGSHFILATGETQVAGQRTWYINDPGGCEANLFSYPLTTLLARYNNKYANMYWAVALSGTPRLASLTFGLASPAELLVTDPLGRRTGVDPISGQTYNEIPEASYLVGSTADDGGAGGPPTHPIKLLTLPEPADGIYDLKVIGTGTGTYTLTTLSYGAKGAGATTQQTGQTSIGQTDVIPVDYDADRPTGLKPDFIYLPLLIK